MLHQFETEAITRIAAPGPFQSTADAARDLAAMLALDTPGGLLLFALALWFAVGALMRRGSIR